MKGMNVNYVSYITYILKPSNILGIISVLAAGSPFPLQPAPQYDLCKSFTMPNSLLLRTHTYASLVRIVYSYVARGSGGCGGRQPQISRPGWIYSPTGRRNLFFSLSRKPVVQQDHGHCPRRNGQDRPGILSPGAASSRSLGSQRALVGNG